MWYGTVYRSGHSYPRHNVNPNSLKNLEPGTAKKKRYTGKLNTAARETFISRCIAMSATRRYRLKTFILTYRKGNDNIDTTKKELNSFLTYLRQAYKLYRYAYTLEIGENGILHYHFIVDSRYIPHEKLNQAWASARDDYAPNAVRAIKNLQGRNLEQAAKYASKYMSKSRRSDNEKSNPTGVRLWATSNSLVDTEKYAIPDYWQLINKYKPIEIHFEFIDRNTGELILQTFYRFSIQQANELINSIHLDSIINKSRHGFDTNNLPKGKGTARG
jgi:hypothetical protein